MYNLASNRYYAGDLPGADAGDAPTGSSGPRSLGMTWSVYGVELHMFRSLIRYVSGDLTPARSAAVPDELADTLSRREPVRGRGPRRRRRGRARSRPGAARGRATGSSRWSRAAAPSTPTRGAASSTRRSRSRCGCSSTCGAPGPTTSWAASGWSRWRIERAGRRGRAGAPARAGRVGARWRWATGCSSARRRPPNAAGRAAGGWARRDGRGWRVRTPSTRGSPASTTPELWRATVAEFDYGYRYEVARSRFRLAEALLEARRPGRRARTRPGSR